MIGIRGAMLLTAAMGLLACSGGGSGSENAVPAPRELVASLESPQAFRLAWTPPEAPVDGFALEGRIDEGAFHLLNSSLIQGDSTGAVVTLVDSAPDLATYTFRLRAARAGKYSAYSNEASCLRPLNAPTPPLIRMDPDGTSLDLTWTITSTTADATRIERQEARRDGSLIQDWTEVARVEPAVLTYRDAALVEDRVYAYRVTSLRQGVPSQGALSRAVVAPLIAPDGLTVIPIDTGFRITWRNRSPVASQVKILRGPSEGAYGETAATLPSTVTSYDDLGLGLGYYTYRVAPTSNGTSFSSVSDPVSVKIDAPGQLSITSAPLSLASEVSLAFLRAQEGEWAFADIRSGTLFGTAGPGAWPSYSTGAEVWWAPPFLRFDAQGRPHGLFRDPGGPGNTHFWFDGAAWITETFQAPVFDNPTYSPPATHFCLDGAGSPHVLLDRTDAAHGYGHGGSSATLTYGRKVDGVWAVESLGGLDPAIDGIHHCHLFVSGSGKAHALLQGDDWIVEVTRGLDGVWTSEALPLGGFQDPHVAETNTLRAAWIDDDTAWVLYWDASGATPGFRVMRKVAGAWQAPELVAPTFTQDSASTNLAISPDQTRLAFVTNTLRGLKIVDHSDAGWRETLLGPQIGSIYYDWWSVLAFDAQNKLRLLTWSAQAGFMDYRE